MMFPMSAHVGMLLAITIPVGGLALFALAFLVLGRRMRSLRREGRVTYSANSTSGSNDFSSPAM